MARSLDRADKGDKISLIGPISELTTLKKFSFDGFSGFQMLFFDGYTASIDRGDRNAST